MIFPRAAAQQFYSPAQVLDVREYGNGNVNDTFLVTVGSRMVCKTHPTLPSVAMKHEDEIGIKVLPKTEDRGPKTAFIPPPDSEGESRFILQRLNIQVFPRPELVMGNLLAVTEHVPGAAVTHFFTQIKALTPVRRRPYEVFGPGSRGEPASAVPKPVSAHQYSRDLFS